MFGPPPTAGSWVKPRGKPGTGSRRAAGLALFLDPRGLVALGLKAAGGGGGGENGSKKYKSWWEPGGWGEVEVEGVHGSR